MAADGARCHRRGLPRTHHLGLGLLGKAGPEPEAADLARAARAGRAEKPRTRSASALTALKGAAPAARGQRGGTGERRSLLFPPEPTPGDPGKSQVPMKPLLPSVSRWNPAVMGQSHQDGSATGTTWTWRPPPASSEHPACFLEASFVCHPWTFIFPRDQQLCGFRGGWR